MSAQKGHWYRVRNPSQSTGRQDVRKAVKVHGKAPKRRVREQLGQALLPFGARSRSGIRFLVRGSGTKGLPKDVLDALKGAAFQSLAYQIFELGFVNFNRHGCSSLIVFLHHKPKERSTQTGICAIGSWKFGRHASDSVESCANQPPAATSSSGVPCSMIRPSSRTTTKSASFTME
jgi:hypothetical protein